MLILGLMNSCTVLNGRYITPTRPFSLNINPPPGTPQFRLGWQHGCESALSGVNTTANLMAGTHRYYINGQLWNENERYKTAWNDAYNYCVYHMFSFLQNNL